MRFTFTIPDEVSDTLLEQAPAGTLHRLRSYLERIAMTAGDHLTSMPVFTRDPDVGLYRFDHSGWTVFFDVDLKARQVRALRCELTDRTRGLPAGPRFRERG